MIKNLADAVKSWSKSRFCVYIYIYIYIYMMSSQLPNAMGRKVSSTGVSQLSQF